VPTPTSATVGSSGWQPFSMNSRRSMNLGKPDLRFDGAAVGSDDWYVGIG
jgi:hypothetical protein